MGPLWRATCIIISFNGITLAKHSANFFFTFQFRRSALLTSLRPLRRGTQYQVAGSIGWRLEEWRTRSRSALVHIRSSVTHDACPVSGRITGHSRRSVLVAREARVNNGPASQIPTTLTPFPASRKQSVNLTWIFCGQLRSLLSSLPFLLHIPLFHILSTCTTGVKSSL